MMKYGEERHRQEQWINNPPGRMNDGQNQIGPE
jgi:hypothetical protein